MSSNTPPPSPSTRSSPAGGWSPPAPRSAVRRGIGAVGLILALPGFALVVGVATMIGLLFAGLILGVAVCLVLGIAGSYFVARRVKRRRAVEARPAAVLFALAAFAFSAATGLDIVLGFSALSDDVPNPGRTVACIVLIAAWVLATLVWTSGVVIARRRYRAGRPTVVLAVIPGVVMGVLLIASWIVVADTSNVF